MKLKNFTAAIAFAAFAALPSAAAADTLVDNVQGVTIGEDGKIDRFTGLWIDDDGRIREVLDRRDDRPEDPDFYIDGKGQYIIPGLIDSHLHVMGFGLGALTLDLSDTNSLEEALAKIAAYAEENRDRPWILGRGWNQERWGLGRFPTAAELDSVVPDQPVYLQRVDGHAGWANTMAIEAAEVTARTASPDGGRIEKLPSGAPSGVFVDAAEALVTKIIPAPRAADLDRALSEAQSALLRFGITAVADMGTSIQDWQAFRRAGDAGTLNVRIMSYGAGIEQTELIGGSGPSAWLYNDRLRLNGVKLYLDGALGSRGAWLKAPYADDPGNRGLPFLSDAQLRNLMSRASINNFQLAIHAIGDAANADVLNSIDGMAGTYEGDRRWRIEHAQVVSPSDLQAFGEHGTIASFQPVHQTSDRTMAEARLGADRLDGAYAWRTVAETGARLAFGSDAPVESPDPFAGLAVAISRTDADGQPFGGWRPQDSVSREAALAGFTSDGAYAGFADGRFGKLVAGEWADFVMIDRDPMLVSPSELRETKVLQTWVAGRPVYEAE